MKLIIFKYDWSKKKYCKASQCGFFGYAALFANSTCGKEREGFKE